MKPTFTPGPWTCVVGTVSPYIGDPKARRIKAHYVVNQTVSPTHGSPTVGEAEAQANARLIAEAPTAYQLIYEALGALKDLRAGVDPLIDTKDWIKAAQAYLQRVDA